MLLYTKSTSYQEGKQVSFEEIQRQLVALLHNLANKGFMINSAKITLSICPQCSMRLSVLHMTPGTTAAILPNILIEFGIS